MTSNKPYIVRAFYQWLSDNHLTPYISVDVSVAGVMVPMAYVSAGQIVLNVSVTAVGSIALGDEAIELSARFGGKLEHIVVPYGAIAAIYAKENGVGTSLPIEHPVEQPSLKEKPPKAKTLSSVTSSIESDAVSADKVKTKSKASLKVIK